MKSVGEMPPSEPVVWDDDTAHPLFLRFPVNTGMTDYPDSVAIRVFTSPP
jgi:hypothetical protein